MRYLVDANVLSEPTKTSPTPMVVSWLAAHEADLVVDPIILGELQLGIFRLSRGRKRVRLETWFKAVIARLECLPWDAKVSRFWAQLVDCLRRRGIVLPLLDSMIAATALAYELTVVTRNLRGFRRAKVKVLDPFS